MAFSEGVQPHDLPDLGIPSSQTSVKVSVIDTTSRISGIPVEVFVEPQIGAFKILECPAYSFLIENNPKGQKVLFDLGIPMNWEERLPKPIVERNKAQGWKATVTKNVSEILNDSGIDPATINAIIWSHYHWDHVGDPSTFPTTTNLVVGPGFKAKFVPGFPTDPNGRVHESAWQDRTLCELSFDDKESALALGQFRAIDYFGDGSFYIMDVPGHAIGHICALARTTVDPPTFIFMGGDVAHHGGEYRPTSYMPLPREVKPDPRRLLNIAMQTVCPGEMFLELHPSASPIEPFYQITSGDDKEAARRSLVKMLDFDAQDNILCIIAHDAAMLDILDFFPKPANEWKAKGWKEIARWRFLGDFISAEEKSQLR